VIFAVLADVSLGATLARLRRLGPVRLIEACCGVLDAYLLVTFAVLADASLGAALAWLRRLGPVRLIEAWCRALDAGAVDLDRLWTASGTRPLPAASPSWLASGGWVALWSRAHSDAGDRSAARAADAGRVLDFEACGD
jgi:hypothetical protein